MICPKCQHEFKDPGRQKGGLAKSKKKGFGSNEHAQAKAQRRLRKLRKLSRQS